MSCGAVVRGMGHRGKNRGWWWLADCKGGGRLAPTTKRGGTQPAAARSRWARVAWGSARQGSEGGSLTRGPAAQCRRHRSNDFETNSKFKLIQLNSNPLQL
jgi:hypothetical protein